MSGVFHFAFNVTDLEVARGFYGGLLGCAEGRSAPSWVDFDFFGHQSSLHLGQPFATAATGRVGDHLVPMPHFGVLLPLDEWRALAARLQDAGVAFEVPPSVRFEARTGRAVDDVFHRSLRQPDRDQGIRRQRRGLCTVAVGCQRSHNRAFFRRLRIICSRLGRALRSNRSRALWPLP